MHVLFVALGSSGDVHPLIGIGLSLRQRGHRVTIVTSVHFERPVRRAGLEFVGLGTEEEYQAITSDPKLFHPIKGTKRVLEYCCVRTARDVYEIIANAYEPDNTIVISSTLGIGARIAHEKTGVPLITTILQPMLIRSAYATPRYNWLPLPQSTPRILKRAAFRTADRYVDSIVGPETNRFRSELGLNPVRRICDVWWLSPQLVIGLFPDWFGPPQPDWPANAMTTGFPMYDDGDDAELPTAARALLEGGDPPIVFTPGSAMRYGRPFFDAAVDACRALGRRGILLSRFREHIPPRLPDGVFHFDYLPLGRVLPRAAAMVHHGGMGTLAQTLRAGVPHLVMPMSIDQPDNAARLKALGVADVLRPGSFRGPAVAR
jgi:UDP:flavonoid glycosyltransferase YjiC (YdhE family)